MIGSDALEGKAEWAKTIRPELRALYPLLEHREALGVFRKNADSYPMHTCKSTLPKVT